MDSLLKTIQSKYSSFSEKEKKIADFLLSSPAAATQCHIKEIADQTGVSVASITRFSKKVLCQSFVELKLKLARESYDHTKDELDVELKNQYKEMFNDIESLIENEPLKEVLSLIKKAKRLFIYGLGSSGLAAQEFNYRLSRMGFYSEAVTDPHLMIIRSVLLEKDDVVIAFSRSGQTKDLLKSLEAAKGKKAKLIAFTAFGDTPLTKMAHKVIWTIHPVRYQYLSTGLDMSVLYLIDLISFHLLKNEDRKRIYTETVNVISGQ